MRKGYVKFWRKSLESGWLQNHELWVFWSWSLLKASHKVIAIKIGFQEIILQPGEFVFGRHKASKELKMSERQVRSCLGFLKKAGNVTIKTTNKFSIISIANWNIYQSIDSENERQDDQPPTSHRPQTRINKNVKNKYSVDFLTFWERYPVKVGKDKAWKVWQRREKEIAPSVILEAIEKQDLWRKSAKTGEFRPEWKNPATWLSQGCWTDEIQEEKRTVW